MKILRSGATRRSETKVPIIGNNVHASNPVFLFGKLMIDIKSEVTGRLDS